MICLCENFTSFGDEKIGPIVNGQDHLGRFEVTKNPRDLYEFPVAPLRNVALIAQDMHSGAFETLNDTIDHYNDPVANIRHIE